MTGVRRLEYAEVNVKNQSEAVAFYTDVMGLEVVDSDGEIKYLNCGASERYCLGVRGGGTGVDRFAVRVAEERYQALRQRAEERGAKPTPVNPQGPAVEDGFAIDLPSGITLDVVTVADRPYVKSTEAVASPTRAAVAPIELDHITLMTDDIEGDIEFLQDLVGYRVSDYHLADDEGNYRFAWGRIGEYHHDIAFVATDDSDQTLHHLAWTMSSLEHLATFADTLSQAGLRLETGISRHHVGSNIFAYFQEPGGNRFEMSTEMATVDTDSEPIVNGPSVNTFTAWGGIAPPDSFANGS